MKKRILSLFMLVLMMSTLCCNALAVSSHAVDTNAKTIEASRRASSYLSTYSVSLTAKTNHRMAIDATVYGTSVMDKIGVSIVKIEQKTNGVWSNCDTLYAINNPDFYQYNTLNYVNTISFYGTQGVQYRVTLTVYAGKGSGSDSATVSSYVITCN